MHEHLSAEFMLTSDCNMACSYCIARDLPKGTLSLQDALKGVDLFLWLSQGASTVEFAFTGGEPLLRSPVLERLIPYAEEKARAAGMRASFVLKTNGLLLRPEVRAFLREHQATAVVSIDGSDVVHDTRRVTKQGGSTHSVVWENLKAAMREGLTCVASVTVHPDDAGALPACVRRLHENGAQDVRVGPVYGTAAWSEEATRSFLASMKDVARYVRAVIAGGGRLEVGPLHRGTKHVGGGLKDCWGCRAGTTNIAFMPDGRITGCSSLAMLAGIRPQLAVGDIGGGIRGKALERLLEVARAGRDRRAKCRTCAAADDCSGGCLAINLSQSGDPFSPPDFYCRMISQLPEAWALAYVPARQDKTLEERPMMTRVASVAAALLGLGLLMAQAQNDVKTAPAQAPRKGSQAVDCAAVKLKAKAGDPEAARYLRMGGCRAKKDAQAPERKSKAARKLAPVAERVSAVAESAPKDEGASLRGLMDNDLSGSAPAVAVPEASMGPAAASSSKAAAPPSAPAASAPRAASEFAPLPGSAPMATDESAKGSRQGAGALAGGAALLLGGLALGYAYGARQSSTAAKLGDGCALNQPAKHIEPMRVCTYNHPGSHGCTYNNPDSSGCTYNHPGSHGCTYNNPDSSGCTYNHPR